MDRSDLPGWLRLTLTPGLGRGTARRLLAALGPPQAVFAAPREAWVEIAGSGAARALAAEPAGLAAQLGATAAWLEDGPGARALLALGDPRYPASLLATADPPLLLYVQGRIEALAGGWPRAVAVVGSRSPTPQGRDNARAFGRSLAAAGWCVVSGLALGVDAAAHEGALDAAGAGPLATLAVLGTGLDTLYPQRHEALAGRVARQGLLLSEYPLGTPPLARNFPQRNRVIAGLSAGTLVVEAALRSGSLITARMAAEQGREVFAIPGSIHSPQSRGCHALLREGARLVETAQDILDELQGMQPPRALPQAAPDEGPAPGVTRDPVLRALGQDPASLDAVAARCGWAAGPLQARLMELELEGQVARLPGGLYQRRAMA